MLPERDITVRSDTAKNANSPTDGSEKDRPTSAESFSGLEVDDGESDEAQHDDIARQQSTDSAPVLTLSRARAIALVATVTGASFLNVSASTYLSTYS